MTIDDYLALVTSEHAQRPRYIDTVSTTVSPFVAVQNVLAGMREAFSVETAIGAQEDAVGLWVGVTRNLAVPLEDVYFTWDDVDADGWDFGSWQGPGDPDSGLVSLPDDAFRLLIKGKIAANQWDGSIEGAYDVIEAAYSGEISIVIIDNQDMTMTVGVTSTRILTTAEKAIITQGYIPLKPEGVRINFYFIVPAGGKLFAWGLENPVFGGWGVGVWPEVS